MINPLLRTRHVACRRLTWPIRPFQTSSLTHKQPTDLEDFTKVFHFPHVVTLARFQRVKIALTAASVALSPLIYFNDLGVEETSNLIGVIWFSCGTLLAFGEFFRKVVGILYMDKRERRVRVAHINFWGKRQDFIVNLDDIKFITDTGTRKDDIYWAMQFHKEAGTRSPMRISTRYGGIEDPRLFRLIFGQGEIPK